MGGKTGGIDRLSFYAGDSFAKTVNKRQGRLENGMSRVIVAGGGAAGMYAAMTAAEYGHEVTLIEQNEKLGKKLFITGKGRCNLTNAADLDTVFGNIVTNPKFLYSSIHTHTNRDVMDTMQEKGLTVKVERGERVFPVSDHSSDVIRALERGLKEAGVNVLLNTRVEELIIENGSYQGMIVNDRRGRRRMLSDCCILATGGLSYPSTGSTGDGLRMAKKAGHTIEKCRPALVPIEVYEDALCRNMMGLSLKNVNLCVFFGEGKQKKEIYNGFGEMLFTHFGVSGPLVLSASSYINRDFYDREEKTDRTDDMPELLMELDLKPAISAEQFLARVNREFEGNMNKEVKNVLPAMYPAKMVPVLLDRLKLDGNRKIHSITREEKLNLVEMTKHFRLTVRGMRGYNEAIITHGGVNVKEVNPQTMESKKVHGLYFAGEMLDVDALTGGFNLQIAWSSAYAAGSSIEWV